MISLSKFKSKKTLKILNKKVYRYIYKYKLYISYAKKKQKKSIEPLLLGYVHNNICIFNPLKIYLNLNKFCQLFINILIFEKKITFILPKSFKILYKKQIELNSLYKNNNNINYLFEDEVKPGLISNHVKICKYYKKKYNSYLNPINFLFIFNLDAKQDLIHEALLSNIPIIGITSSSTDLYGISYPILCNKSLRSYLLIFYLILTLSEKYKPNKLLKKQKRFNKLYKKRIQYSYINT